MSVTVKIPAPLRPIAGGRSEVELEGATVGEILRQLDAQYKGFGERVLDGGQQVRRFINVYVNEDNIRDRNDLNTEVKAGDTISILPSIAGGNGQRRQMDARGNPPEVRVVRDAYSPL